MHQRVIVIPADRFISVDGKPLCFDYKAPAHVEALHALQWHHLFGHMEFTDGSPNRDLQAGDYMTEVQPFVELWQVEELRLYEEERQRWEEANKPLTLEEARSAKLAEISAAFAAAEAAGHVLSSLGFEIDANERANRDTEGLVTMMTAMGTESTYFCDYNNVMRQVSLEQMRAIRIEIIAHGQALYAKKWGLRQAVNAAASLKEIAAIQWREE